jgi:hypothetical protein
VRALKVRCGCGPALGRIEEVLRNLATCQIEENGIRCTEKAQPDAEFIELLDPNNDTTRFVAVYNICPRHSKELKFLNQPPQSANAGESQPTNEIRKERQKHRKGNSASL